MEKTEQPSTSHKTPRGTKPCTPSTCPVCPETFGTKRGATVHFRNCHPEEYDLRKYKIKYNEIICVRMINEMSLFTNFLTDYISLGYRKSAQKRQKLLCNYCNYSASKVSTMVKHIQDDHPEHLSTSKYEFISQFRIFYIQLEYFMTNCKFLPIS
jgi:hypothetical protein